MVTCRRRAGLRWANLAAYFATKKPNLWLPVAGALVAEGPGPAGRAGAHAVHGVAHAAHAAAHLHATLAPPAVRALVLALGRKIVNFGNANIQ